MTFIQSAIASSYIVYPTSITQEKTLIKNSHFKYVYSKNERKFLRISTKNALIYSGKLSKLKKLCLDCKIEHRSQFNFYNAYENYQWSLSNQGKDEVRWISDIETFIKKGVKGEDIGFIDINELNKVKVAIIDSGIDLKHPDLIGQIKSHPKECSDLKKYQACLRTQSDRDRCHKEYAKVDHDKNGYPLDCNGWNVTGTDNPFSEVSGSAKITDKNGHGTHVAGIVGAKDNRFGIKGIIQNVELIPVQVSMSSNSSDNGELPTDNIAKGVLYAIRAGAQVINLSLGWRINQDSLLMRQMVELAIENNILVVAAAGNDGHDDAVFPCSYKGVICVGSYDIDGKLSRFSNFGPHVDIIAPGTNILSTWPTNKRSRSFTEDPNYELLSGTSQAAPHITGILAKIISSGRSAKSAKSLLFKGARAKNKSSKYIKYGNASLKESLLVKDSSDILDFTSFGPFLFNINGSKQIKLKLNKAVSKKITLLEAKNISFTSTNWISDQEGKFSLTVDQIVKPQKSFFAKFRIGMHESWIQLSPITIVNDKVKDSILYKLNMPSGISLDLYRKFENFNVEDTNEYLGIKDTKAGKMVALVKYENNEYKLTRPFKIDNKDELIIKLSKVDIDLDAKPEYVITTVDLKLDTKTAKFYVFDNNFMPSKLKITKDNTFDNVVTTLPGSFLWLKDNNKMIPTWIGYGKSTINEQVSPWLVPQNLTQNYIYKLTYDGITNLKNENEILPISFLYQSKKSKKAGSAYYIEASGYGFFKTYRVKNTSSDTSYDISLNNYFNFADTRALPVSSTEDDNAFYSIESSNGSINVIALNVSDKLEIKREKISFEGKSILRVLSYDLNGNSISQSFNNLILKTKDLSFSKNAFTDGKRIKHYLLKTRPGVVLSSSLTPNLASHGIALNEGSFIESSNLQIYNSPDCQEVGNEVQNKQDFLTFICKNSQIIKIKL
jgi:subtilisin family serine protease